MTPTLTLQCLTKTYAGQRALSDVSLTVAAGERVALLGHNGAGKSTMMKIILGLIPHDSGSLQVTGAAAGSPEARRNVAYLPENAAFHPALTGLEQIRHYLSLRGEAPSLAMGLLERVGLGHAARRRIGTYSKGMRQRVGLAQTLIGKPRLLVLDEPTSGLDPVSRRDFYALLDGLASEGASILLSSHALTEVEARTDRIIILSGGVLVAEGALADLRRKADLPVSFQITPKPGFESDLAAALPQATPLSGYLSLSCAQHEKLPLMARITALADKIADFDVQPPSLEDIYSHFSKRAGQ
jgi:Cu-processing system ATP-binding protein